MSTWSATQGDKQKCRELLISSVREHIATPINCFLLPGEEAIDAKLIKQEFNCRIIGVERDYARCQKIEESTRGFMHIENTDIRDYIKVQDYKNNHTKAKPTLFDFAFLDYLCGHDDNCQKEIEDFVKLLMKPTSILALTFNKASRKGREKFDSFVSHNTFLNWDHSLDAPEDDWRKEDTNTPENIAAAIYGRLMEVVPYIHCDLLHAFEYQANPDTNSNYMHYIVIKIEKR